MKRYLAFVAAFSLACSLYAQDWGQVKNLYQAGMYSETLRLVQGNNTPMAEGYRALCALKLKTAHSHDIAKAFIARYHEKLSGRNIPTNWGTVLLRKGSGTVPRGFCFA